MKNSADLGGCYPPRPSASVDNTLLDLQNSLYPTQPHSIIPIIPLLDVIVLTMKTKFTIPILQRALQLKKKHAHKNQKNAKSTLLFLGHRTLIKNKKQTAVTNILNLHIF